MHSEDEPSILKLFMVEGFCHKLHLCVFIFAQTECPWEAFATFFLVRISPLLSKPNKKMSTTTPQTLKPKDIVKPDDVMTWELAW